MHRPQSLAVVQETPQISATQLSSFNKVRKRTFDLVLSAAALILFSPIFLIILLTIKLATRAPALSREQRHGYRNEAICIFKFHLGNSERVEGESSDATRASPFLTDMDRRLRRRSVFARRAQQWPDVASRNPADNDLDRPAVFSNRISFRTPSFRPADLRRSWSDMFERTDLFFLAFPHSVGLLTVAVCIADNFLAHGLRGHCHVVER